MSPDDRDTLIAELCSATRETRATGEIVWSKAFSDLDADGREKAFEEALVERRLEAALSPNGTSGTARAVLAKIRGVRP